MSDALVNVTLSVEDAQLVVGVLEGEKLRAREAEDEPPESAAAYGCAQEFFLQALRDRDVRPIAGESA